MTANQLNRIIYENIITSVRQDDHLIRRHQFKKMISRRMLINTERCVKIDYIINIQCQTLCEQSIVRVSVKHL